MSSRVMIQYQYYSSTLVQRIVQTCIQSQTMQSTTLQPRLFKKRIPNLVIANTGNTFL